MATGRDKLRIFENVVARVGFSGDVVGEFAKALSALNGIQAYNDAIEPTMSQLPPQGQNLPPEQSNNTGFMSPANEMGQNIV